VTGAIGLHHYLLLGALLVALGTVGVLVRRNAIVIFMSVELILNGAALTILAYNYHRFPASSAGSAMTFFIIAVAAAEAAVGLAIIVTFHRHRQSVNVDEGTLLRY
jgi:NADH:ubiquinone oxidoreductase subunit K